MGLTQELGAPYTTHPTCGCVLEEACLASRLFIHITYPLLADRSNYHSPTWPLIDLYIHRHHHQGVNSNTMVWLCNKLK